MPRFGGHGGPGRRAYSEMKLPDLPLVDVYRQGRLDLDAFVSEESELDEVEAAFERIHHGDLVRSVVIL
jgi:S-(hydroxymethyl)mycothiol dehydrogenase